MGSGGGDGAVCHPRLISLSLKVDPDKMDLSCFLMGPGKVGKVLNNEREGGHEKGTPSLRGPRRAGAPLS